VPDVVTLGEPLVCLLPTEPVGLDEAGALALSIGGAVAVREVVDPVGAGDAFNAGFLSCRLRGGGIADALRAGNELGAAAVTSLGDSAMDVAGR
jgi:2-dehydro-3-deoxygluconokinase